MSTTARRVLVAVLGVVPAVFTAASAWWWWSALPSSLPTHWSALNRPDDFSPRASTVAVVISLTAVGALVVVGSCIWFHRSPLIAQAMTAVGGFMTGLVAGIWSSIAASTLLAPSPDQADIGWWLVLALAAGAWALLAALLRPPHQALAPEDLELDEGAPLRRVAPGERVSWSKVIGPTWLTWVTAALLVVETAIAVVVPAATPGAVVALVVTVLFARLEITVDRRGLRVVAGLVRLPLKRIAVDRVARVEVVEGLRPMEWGGWGYRVLPGRTALVLRAGPALVVTTGEGHRFAATIDDPATPAGLLNGLAAARTSAGQAPPASWPSRSAPRVSEPSPSRGRRSATARCSIDAFVGGVLTQAMDGPSQQTTRRGTGQRRGRRRPRAVAGPPVDGRRLGRRGRPRGAVGEDVVIRHHGRHATTLRGAAAQRFLADVDGEPQQLMARVTGDYEHGNERAAKKHPRDQGR